MGLENPQLRKDTQEREHMNDTNETPKKKRTRRWVVALVAALVALTLIPTAGWASDRFSDVDDGNVFHDDIAWLADTGVTLGCNPPENTMFCPKDDVTREQMAAFLHRFAQATEPEPRDDVEVFSPDSMITRTSLDEGDTGFSPGDTIVEYGDLVDPETGDEIGQVRTRLQVISVNSPTDFEFYLDCTVKLADGELMFGGAGSAAEIHGDGDPFALRGGTGAYEGAAGTATVSFGPVNGDDGHTLAFDFTN